MREKLNRFMLRNSPPGIDLRWQVQFFVTGWLLAGLYADFFFVGYGNARSNLFYYHKGRQILDSTARMKDFVDLLDFWHLGYLVLAVCCVLMIAVNFAYHYQNSKSVYTMRRLPQRWEFERRCTTLPLIMAGIAIVWMYLSVLFLFAVYMIFTPAECLVPGQFGKLIAGFVG